MPLLFIKALACVAGVKYIITLVSQVRLNENVCCHNTKLQSMNNIQIPLAYTNQHLATL